MELPARANNVPMPNLGLKEGDVEELIRFMEGTKDQRHSPKGDVRTAVGARAQ
jgi:hypothetical protein